MYGQCQIFTIVAIIYSSISVLAAKRFPNENCDCDVLQVNETSGVIGNQNFTKQNDTLNGKPYYFSIQRNMLSWDNHYWTYDKYNALTKMFESLQKNYSNYAFSFAHKCKPTKFTFADFAKTGQSLNSQCLKKNSNCLATRELTRSFTDGIHSKQVKLQAKDPCQFPFKYKNVIYNSCTKMDHDRFWCATTVDSTNHKTSWGYCNNLCPMEGTG